MLNCDKFQGLFFFVDLGDLDNRERVLVFNALLSRTKLNWTVVSRMIISSLRSVQIEPPIYWSFLPNLSAYSFLLT